MISNGYKIELIKEARRLDALLGETSDFGKLVLEITDEQNNRAILELIKNASSLEEILSWQDYESICDVYDASVLDFPEPSDTTIVSVFDFVQAAKAKISEIASNIASIFFVLLISYLLKFLFYVPKALKFFQAKQLCP